ncbi:MAG: Hsp20/alpha crystallin family protein [Candidatus Hydrogenedentes bacterium]|nr:Hsp20/alpha crystallin family protein [Candidatus Hydrogenedentota bacterium]
MMTNATREQYVTPRVNVLEDAEAVTIEADFPGVANGGAEVELRDGHLILKGDRKSNGTSGRYRIHERQSAGFYRAFALGDAIDTEKIDAKMMDGVLTVTLQKVDRLKPKTISIH